MADEQPILVSEKTWPLHFLVCKVSTQRLALKNLSVKRLNVCKVA